MELSYMVIFVALVMMGVGGLIGWLIGRGQSNATVKQEMDSISYKLAETQREFITLEASSKSQLDAQANRVAEKQTQIESLKEELEKVVAQFDLNKQALATANAINVANSQKLESQKREVEEMSKKFNTEFENIANKILDTKTEKFTELNKTNLKAILDPLGENIKQFKEKVNETYDKESKERFSLGERVKELAQLNQVISEEARNLTKALKGEVKTQGRWGEMILENILEKSGLRKDEEYFIEYQLEDQQGKALRSDLENKKMRPDAVIKYPDNRTVIIDSKVSLNAYTRFIEATDAKEQKAYLEDHVTAIKNHILTLSAKGYDDYDKSLDFVMMFIPSEPAYTAALQGDSNLWNFAYDKRILLINPTNLIISLKLIVDLWKREYQNQNAQAIAERGARLYEKFVGFVSNLEEVGKHIDKAKEAYTDSYKQLSTGHGNLVTQATQLKNLGLATKKELPKTLVENSGANSLLD
ncbi:MAG: DNA recombination protein RmuC [Bacteroidales bacterium]|nr:DNA recombination protein RmuC [Bacteroidales bacterium]MDD4657305.1 DNA recombination protein RmuC [Bacteroidales bacterium]